MSAGIGTMMMMKGWMIRIRRIMIMTMTTTMHMDMDFNADSGGRRGSLTLVLALVSPRTTARHHHSGTPNAQPQLQNSNLPN